MTKSNATEMRDNLSLASRLRECINNPHKSTDQSEAFKKLMAEAADYIAAYPPVQPAQSANYFNIAVLLAETARNLRNKPYEDIAEAFEAVLVRAFADAQQPAVLPVQSDEECAREIVGSCFDGQFDADIAAYIIARYRESAVAAALSLENLNVSDITDRIYQTATGGMLPSIKRQHIEHYVREVMDAAQPADAVREALRQFSLEVIKARCWFSDDSLDGGDLQDLAEKLGLVKPYVVSAEDHEEGRWGDYDIGDIIFVPLPSLAASQTKGGA